MAATETQTMNEKPERTDLLPAVRTSDVQLDKLSRLGTWLAASEKADEPKGRDGMTAALRFYYAEQLGLPATAVAELAVIHGKLFIGAALMRYFAERGGYRVIRKETSATTCTASLIVAETGQEIGSTTFTIEDARTAGLIKPNSGWQKYPERMLWQRASSYVIRDFAPGVALGLATTDEIPDYTGQAAETYVQEHAEEAEYEPVLDPDLEKIPFGDDD